MSTITTRPRGAAVAIVALVLAVLSGLAATPVAAAGTPTSDAIVEVELTFDWPLGCDVTVLQHHAKGLAGPGSVVAYTMRLDEGGAPGNLVVTFGDAEIVELIANDGTVVASATGAVSAYLTNPTIEIDRGGMPVAYGYEEWAERRAEAGDDPLDTTMLPPVEHRIGISTWPTWVSLWAQLDVVDTTGTESTAPASFVNEDGSTIEFALATTAERAADGSVAVLGTWTLNAVRAELLVVTDPATLRPFEATFEYSPRDADTVIDRYDWTFDWSACESAPGVGELAAPPATSMSTSTTAAPEIAAVTVPGFPTIHVDELPPEAHDTLALIAAGGPFPHRQDDVVFENREGLLPRQPRGYYREFTVETPGLSHRGTRRIVTGDGGELFYTDDHYDSFRVIVY